jgi:hypothetical protein
MEPVRPQVDRYLYGLLTSTTLALSDFHETRQGVCRVTPRLAAEPGRSRCGGQRSVVWPRTSRDCSTAKGPARACSPRR